MGEQQSLPRGALVCKRQKCLLLLGILSLAAASARGTGNDPPKAQALVRESVSITLDGRLDEPVWREAPVLKLTRQ
jgi:hypothetical protein